MSDLDSGVRRVRGRAVQRLGELHDEYVRTGRVWQDVLLRAEYGGPLPVVFNRKTGNAIGSPAEWLDRGDVSLKRLRVRTFKDLIGAFERFVADLLTVWLRAHPELVEERSITLATLLACTTLAEAKATAVDEAVTAAVLKRMYGRPAGWFAFLRDHAGGRAAKADVDRFVERKAARDALEHNDGLVGDAYADKAGPAAAYAVGDLVEPDDAAIDDLYELVLRLVAEAGAARP